MTGFSRLSRFGMTYKPLTGNLGEKLLMSYLEDFHAKTSQPQEKVLESTENLLECGEKWHGSFTKYSPDTFSWKTHQCSLLGDLEEFSETWPQWGLMRNGECWERQTLVPTTKETEYGLSEQMWPTPCATDYKGSGKTGALRDRLDYAAERGATKSKTYTWPTPRTKGMCGGSGAWAQLKANTTIEEARLMGAGNGGQLNPTWVEWLMGWPLGWTDLKPLAMDKSLSAPPQHGDFWMTHKDAMRILDKVKDGVLYPEKIINMALELTGDLQQT
jgi:hypothetical protein